MATLAAALFLLSGLVAPAQATGRTCMSKDVVACFEEAQDILEMFEAACAAGSARACLRAAQFHGSESYARNGAGRSAAALEQCGQGGDCVFQLAWLVAGTEMWEVDDQVVYTRRAEQLGPDGLPLETLAEGPVYTALRQSLAARRAEGFTYLAVELTEDLPTEALERIASTAREAGYDEVTLRVGERVVVLELQDPGERPEALTVARSGASVVLPLRGPELPRPMVVQATAASSPSPTDGAGPPPGEGEPIRLGALDKGLIESGIQKHMKKIRACYQAELNRDHALGGKVVIKFVIAPEGHVQSSKVKYHELSGKKGTEGGDRAAACIAEVFGRMSFPEPKGDGIVIVSYPLVFAPG